MLYSNFNCLIAISAYQTYHESWIMPVAPLQTSAILRSSPLLRHVERCQMAGCCTAASRLLDKSWCVWKWCLQCIPTCPNGHWNREHDDNPVEFGVAYWRLTQLWRAIFVVAVLWPHWFCILLFGKFQNNAKKNTMQFLGHPPRKGIEIRSNLQSARRKWSQYFPTWGIMGMVLGTELGYQCLADTPGKWLLYIYIYRIIEIYFNNAE